MALLHMEGFQDADPTPVQATDFQLNGAGWRYGGSISSPVITSGRWGAGSYAGRSLLTECALYAPWAHASDRWDITTGVVIGFAWKRAGGGGHYAFGLGGAGQAYTLAKLGISLSITTCRLYLVGVEIGSWPAALVLSGGWEYLEVKVDRAASTITVNQNGTQVYTGTHDVESGGWVSWWASAEFWWSGQTAALSGDNLYWTDIYICNLEGPYNDDFLGECRVQTLNASTVGNVMQFPDGLGVDAADSVNDVYCDYQTSYIEGTQEQAEARFFVTGTIPAGTIHGIIATAITNGYDSANEDTSVIPLSAKAMVMDGSKSFGPDVKLRSFPVSSPAIYPWEVYSGFPGAPPSFLWTTVNAQFDRRADGSAWTAAAIGDAEFGIRLTPLVEVTAFASEVQVTDYTVPYWEIRTEAHTSGIRSMTIIQDSGFGTVSFSITIDATLGEVKLISGGTTTWTGLPTTGISHRVTFVQALDGQVHIGIRVYDNTGDEVWREAIIANGSFYDTTVTVTDGLQVTFPPTLWVPEGMISRVALA